MNLGIAASVGRMHWVITMDNFFAVYPDGFDVRLSCRLDVRALGWDLGVVDAWENVIGRSESSMKIWDSLTEEGQSAVLIAAFLVEAWLLLGVLA